MKPGRPARKTFAAGSPARQGCIKLGLEDLRRRGWDNLFPQFQAHTAGDKLSPLRKAELDATLPARRPCISELLAEALSFGQAFGS